MKTLTAFIILVSISANAHTRAKTGYSDEFSCLSELEKVSGATPANVSADRSVRLYADRDGFYVYTVEAANFYAYPVGDYVFVRTIKVSENETIEIRSFLGLVPAKSGTSVPVTAQARISYKIISPVEKIFIRADVGAILMSPDEYKHKTGIYPVLDHPQRPPRDANALIDSDVAAKLKRIQAESADPAISQACSLP